MQLRAQQLLASGQRTLAWAATLLDEAGFAGANDDIAAHYKATAAFVLGGRQDAATRVADHLGRRFHDRGDFHANRRDATARTGGANYRNAWIVRGLHLLGRYELSEAGFTHLQAQLDDRTGGCQLRPSGWGGDPEIDFGTTCAAAITFLAGGRIHDAKRCGAFLARCVAEQLTSGKRLHLRFTTAGNAIRPTTGGSAPFVIDAESPPDQQLYWPLGMALTAFARLSRATGANDWQKPADLLLDFIIACGPGVASHITNGKIAWGLGEMSLVAQSPAYRTLAEAFLRNILEAQEASGVWVRRPQYATEQTQPIATSLDTSLERASYMFDLAKVFSD